MIIEVYAALKDHFQKRFEFETQARSVSELREALLQFRPAAAGTLALSRFAIGDNFVNDDELLNSMDTISIIPPSSGG